MTNSYSLSIETSCDDTSVSIMNNHLEVKNLTFSQTVDHQKFGGIIPEVASRLHSQKIFALIDLLIKESKINYSDLKFISVTIGPGLSTSLQVGLIVAKTLSQFLKIPLYEINHLEAHIYSPFINSKKILTNKFIFLVISGGHTILGLVDNFKIKVYGQTLDDSIGEAYDKVGRILGFPYPGGKEIDAISKNQKDYLELNTISVKGFNFSFSGLKSKMNQLNNLKKYEPSYLAKTFQVSAINHLLSKVKKLSAKLKVNDIVVSGGVSANSYLREVSKDLKFKRFIFPEKKYSTDNATMIGYLTYLKLNKNILNASKLDIDIKQNLFL